MADAAQSGPFADDGRPRTLSDQDPDLAARHAAYQKRQKIKDKRRSKGLSGDTFLSNVQETEDDIAYRFSFVIVGSRPLEVVQQLCRSEKHRRLSGYATEQTTNKSIYRCLCEVQVTLPGKEKGPLVSKVAKLALTPTEFDQDFPIWETRQESMSTAIVYVLWIDGKTAEGEPNFDDQLQGLKDSLALLRSTCKARLRPVKALLLLYDGGEYGAAAAPKSLERWALSLSDFEQVNGDFWKFGPVCASDVEQLHASFSEMASMRLRHIQTAKDLPGDEASVEVNPLEQELFKFKGSAGNVVIKGPASDAGGSSRSEQELPPAFEAEASGSECSESAIELHRAAFGLEDPGSPLSPRSPEEPATPINLAETLSPRGEMSPSVDTIIQGSDMQMVSGTTKGACCFFC